MSRFQPICVSEKAAASMLDISLEKFRALVSAGHLPRGKDIGGGIIRWSVDDLRMVVSGTAADGFGGIKW